MNKIMARVVLGQIAVLLLALLVMGLIVLVPSSFGLYALKIFGVSGDIALALITGILPITLFVWLTLFTVKLMQSGIKRLHLDVAAKK